MPCPSGEFTVLFVRGGGRSPVCDSLKELYAPSGVLLRMAACCMAARCCCSLSSRCKLANDRLRWYKLALLSCYKRATYPDIGVEEIRESWSLSQDIGMVVLGTHGYHGARWTGQRSVRRQCIGQRYEGYLGMWEGGIEYVQSRPWPDSPGQQKSVGGAFRTLRLTSNRIETLSSALVYGGTDGTIWCGKGGIDSN